MSARLIIITVIFTAVLVAGFVLVWPKYQDFQSVLSKLQQKEAELNSKTAYYSKIKEIWERLEKYEDVLAKIDSAFPNNYSIPVLFNYLQKTTGETGLVLENLTFEGVTGDKVKEISIRLEVSGDYSSFKNFLSAIENSARFFKVKSISFSSSKEGKFSFDLGIATYSY